MNHPGRLPMLLKTNLRADLTRVGTQFDQGRNASGLGSCQGGGKVFGKVHRFCMGTEGLGQGDESEARAMRQTAGKP